MLISCIPTAKQYPILVCCMSHLWFSVTFGSGSVSIVNLDVLWERLWQREPNKKQISNTEGQSEQSWSLVEDISCCSGADGKVGAHQRSNSEAQREGDADHGLVTIKLYVCFFSHFRHLAEAPIKWHELANQCALTILDMGQCHCEIVIVYYDILY